MARLPGASSDSGWEVDDLSDMSDNGAGVVDRRGSHQLVRTPGFAVHSLPRIGDLEGGGDDSEEVGVSPFTVLSL